MSGAKPWLDGVKGDEVLRLIETDGVVLRCEAGPGTGKTFGLTRRVERLIHPEGDGIDPKEVLVVAFNRVIAADLRAEITARLFSVSLEDMPRVQTIHSLCLELIEEDNARLLLPHEADAMLEDVLFRHPDLKAAFETKAKTAQALRDHEAGHAKNVTLWQAVRAWLVQHKASLVSELPSRLLDDVSSGAIPDAQYGHVIVDEFQDLSRGEQELLALLRSEDGSLLALGDPRQSIYLFRGNDRHGLDRLEEITGKNVVDLPMSDCRRCPPEIVAAANQLTALDPATPLEPTTKESANVHLVWWKTPPAEASGMADAITENLIAYPTHDHLVMVTRRKFGYALRDAVHAIDPDIAVQLSFSEYILELWAVREAFLFFCLMADRDPCTWRAWFAYRAPTNRRNELAANRNADAYSRLLDASGGEISPATVTALLKEERSKRRGKGGKNVWDRSARYSTLLESRPWDTYSAEELIQEAFEPSLWISADSDDYEMASHDMEILRSAAIETLVELGDTGDPGMVQEMLQGVARKLRYRIAVRDPLLVPEDASLRVSTMWGAKGLTADHVYLIGAADEALPGSRNEDFPGTDIEYFEEQLRLFYVSITRAKKTLVVSWPQKVRWGELKQLRLKSPRRGSRHWARLRKTQFLTDVIPALGSTPEEGAQWGGCVSIES